MFAVCWKRKVYEKVYYLLLCSEVTPTTLHSVLWCVSSPHSHLTVHHTGEIKLGQQILHLVVFLAVLLYVSMVTGDVRAKHVPHQEGQTTLLTVTVFLKDISKNLLAFYTFGYTDSVWTWMHQRNCLWNSKEGIAVKGCLTFNIRPLAPALKLPVKRHTFTVKQLNKAVRSVLKRG